MRNFFKGWYYKIQSQKDIVAFIPSFNADANGHQSCSIQIVTKKLSDLAGFNFDEFHIEKAGFLPKICIGNSVFSEGNVKLDFETNSHLVKGELFFGPLARPKYDIMGPFALVPFMECRHSVYSMLHSVQGNLEIDDKVYNFSDSIGYIEGDEGRSFPKEYLWTQYISEEFSVMLSVAEIPFLGSRFTGVIGFVYSKEREIRLATYLGAKADFIGGGKAVIKQGEYTFTAEMLSGGALPLYAPVSGSMSRFIKENIACTTRYELRKGTVQILCVETERAGFEYEYTK